MGVHHKRFQVEDQANFTLEKISKRPHLNDDVAFALLIAISHSCNAQRDR